MSQITFRARQLGPIRPLSQEQVQRLQQVGRDLGLPARKLEATPCERCNACPGPTRIDGPNAADVVPSDALIARVREQVTRAIRGS